MTETSPDLREQIAEALELAFRHAAVSDSTNSGPIGFAALADAAMVVVRPEIDRRDAEIARLREDAVIADGAIEELNENVLAALRSGRSLKRRAEQAEIELRRLRTLVDKAEQTLPVEQRRLLSVSRMVFDHIAAGRPILTRDEAADLAQRIVDEIGHSVTDEPALGPNFRVEIDQLNATIARVRAVHHLKEWVSLSDVCRRHHAFRTYGPTAENIAVADVCPDCRPRRYMNCVCADDDCPVLAALDQPAESKES